MATPQEISESRAYRRDAVNQAIGYLTSHPEDQRHPITLAEQLGDYILEGDTPWDGQTSRQTK